ncbi:glycosyltransferase family 4 protein [Flagellimonas allohymeniacidonis]|uniref:Glycosyl transferase family 1 n=1 Tax=Flagellimonas allohymeniacidonis TaxID=2517819 RepID=A0A4Q8QKB0_9FLAO|nr:glycosyltransferase family 4 protein [Allomuricauda hymeniacidonis]TAI48676.1 glycosyl transferase family 1 [Allomuricauda hymeniacidonis]
MQKVLIITYYWPPAGGPGVQRWLKFVKYLPEFGYQPIVYIPENPNYPILDKNLLKEVPEGLKILKSPIKEPYRWASLLSKKNTKSISSGIIPEKKPTLVERLLLWIRGNFFIPDARKAWVKPSIAFLSKVLVEEDIKTVITTGPPHSLHLIGMGLKAKYPIQWIADFRDPWTSIGYHKRLKLMASSARKHKTMEHEVLNKADKIITTSETTKQEFEEITKKPIAVITNGYEQIDSSAGMGKAQHFTLSHFGSLLTGRNPESLWTALQELVQENEDFKSALRIQLAGVVGQEVLQSVHAQGLSGFVDELGYLSHQENLKKQQESQILVLLEIDSKETKGIIPGKLFEYLAAKRPILAIGPKYWESAQMVLDTQSGRVFQHNEKDALKTVLLEWFEKYQRGDLGINSKGIEKYHRRSLTEALANFI